MKKPLTISNHNLITAEVVSRLKEVGITPNKTMGQNFLINSGIYEKIVAALEIKRGETIIEVGPGLGTLTDRLLAAGAKIIGVEKDPQLAKYLQNRYRDNDQVEIICEDILKFKPTNNYKLVGNIPYYLTSHLIRTVLESWPMPELIVLMVQKEVAQRICAKPPDMNLLAVSVQYYSEPKIINHVSRGSFYPIPTVDSSIIKIQPRVEGLELRARQNKFFRIVKAGFASKRKQLANNLASGLKIAKPEIEKILNSLNINPSRRAETLTLAEWQNISDNLGSRL